MISSARDSIASDVKVKEQRELQTEAKPSALNNPLGKHLSPVHALSKARMTFVSRVIDPRVGAMREKKHGSRNKNVASLALQSCHSKQNKVFRTFNRGENDRNLKVRLMKVMRGFCR